MGIGNGVGSRDRIGNISGRIAGDGQRDAEG